MEKFKSFITEAKEEPYKLLILSHDDPFDPNETGPMVRKKASELGIEVYLAEFSGMYMEDKGKMDEREYKASLLSPYFNTIPIRKVKNKQYGQPMLQRYISRKK